MVETKFKTEKKVMRCPVCQSAKNSIFLQRLHVPVHQNLLCSSKELARSIKRGNLSLVICKECGFAFNQSFDASLLTYDKDYDNTQMYSSAFRDYIDNLIYNLVNERGITNKTIVEVGCGEGSFLKSLCIAGENYGIGFDPSYSGPSILMDGKIRYKRILYDPSYVSIPVDMIICRHVIEHISDPVGLLNSIRQIATKSRNVQLFFETPSLEWILKNRVFWDFFYEHCSYFTKQSLRIAFEVAGFKVKEIQKAFRHQYLWLEGKLSDGQSHNIRSVSSQIITLAEQFAEKEKLLIQCWRKRLREIRSSGRIAIWGAGAKGVTFANMIDPNCKWIDCLVDLNPNKQGQFVPGTGHPIVSYSDLPKRNIITAILMNPNYHKENQFLLKKAKIKLYLIEK